MRNKGAHFKSKTLRFSIAKNREVQNEHKANENKKESIKWAIFAKNASKIIAIGRKYQCF